MVAPTATTLEEVVRTKFLANSTLLALLAEGADSFFPRAGASPDGSTPAPFVVAKYGSESGRIVQTASFSFYIYDIHQKRYWRIEEIAQEIRNTFHGKRLGETANGYTHWPVDVYVEFKSGQLTDGGWDKNLKIIRLSAAGI